MNFTTDVIFLILSSVNDDLIIYVFAAGVGCEITYVGNAELNNVLYITINFSGKGNLDVQIKCLDDQCLGREQISNLK